MEQKSSSTGLSSNVAGLLCYFLGWVTGLIFILIEKEDDFVRFHAMQSIITFVILNVLSFVASFVPVIGLIISLILWPVSLALWIILMVKAYQGEKFKLPIAGDLAEQYSK
ncbi:MAG: DUF4870 domain-containing protein [Candidatus Subteraquimicrobiales bacterium]|nr:DUF4870 domain-containing protein [Candidatus Subteraquimicrobiales bacterium]